MAHIGDEFKTGDTCVTSGVYRYARHIGGVGCGVTPAQREIPLSNGERFPPLAGCRHPVVWQFVRFA